MPRKAKKQALKRQPKEQRIEAILDAAEQVFNEKGYEKARVSEIAEIVGIVEGTVFRYFSSKHQLVLKILDRRYSALFVDLVEGLRGIKGVRNRLRFIVWNQLKAVTERPELTSVIILAARGFDRQITQEVNTLYQAYSKPLLDTLKQAKKRGEIREDISPPLVSHLLYGGIEQLLWKMLGDGKKPNVEKVADELTDVVFAGISIPTVCNDRGEALLNRLEALLNK